MSAARSKVPLQCSDADIGVVTSTRIYFGDVIIMIGRRAITGLRMQSQPPLASTRIEHQFIYVCTVIGTITEPFILFTFLSSAPKPGKRILVLDSRRDECS